MKGLRIRAFLFRLTFILSIMGFSLVVVVPTLFTFAQPPPPVSGASKDESGCIGVPGSNSSICYRASVGLIPNKPDGFQFWMHTTNQGPAAVSFVACAMISFDKPPLSQVPRYYVSPNSLGEWDCSLSNTPAQNIRPNYHFSCTRVQNLAPGATANPFDEFALVGTPITANDLSSIYWDILQDAPVNQSCNNVKGNNKFLIPSSSSTSLAYNIWVGGAWATLDPVAGRRIRWDLGNWVTMGYMDVYEARLVGTIFDAPPSSTFTFTLGEERREVIETGEGGNIEVNLPFTIISERDEQGSLNFVTESEMAEGQWVSFQGQVFAESVSGFYKPDDYMYSVAANFVQDTRPPEITAIELRLDEVGLFNFRVLATDASSMPAAASVTFFVNDEQVNVFPLNFAIPSMIEDAAVFEAFIHYQEEYNRYVEAEATVTYQIQVADEVGNITASERMLVRPEEISGTS